MAGRIIGRGFRSLSIGLIATVLFTSEAHASSATWSVPSIPVLEGLRTEINFWKAIFATYTTQQVVFHDRDNLSRIYSALDFSDLNASGLGPGEIERRRKAAVNAETERLRALLINLHARRNDLDDMTKEERRIVRMFSADANPMAMVQATEEGRLRAQSGLRDRFLRGLQVSRRYLPMMERIFREQGLPVELTRLPFVESAFNVDAYSKVGAAGLWQFMPSTGRLYMTVNNLVDERRDPWAATAAAAAHLKADFDQLGTWPLAVTAYNHGRGGMSRAVASTGTTDLVKIVREYKGPSFGFASRNFYVEFLAAVEVERDADKHFGVIENEPELKVETVAVPADADFRSLARAAGVEPDHLASLNLALCSEIVSGDAGVPRGYRLRVPHGYAGRLQSQAHLVTSARPAKTTRAAAKAVAKQSGGSDARFVRHRVRKGQTLASIARQYQTTVSAIRRHNRLRDRDNVIVGQTLLIPKG